MTWWVEIIWQNVPAVHKQEISLASTFSVHSQCAMFNILWLVVLTILKNMKVKGRIIPYIKWKIKNVWNHQPVLQCAAPLPWRHHQKWRLSCRRDQQRAIGALLFVLLGFPGVDKNQSAEICQFASAGSGKNYVKMTYKKKQTNNVF